MADPLIIIQDNRSFGWALNDLTLYGAQPGPDIVIGRAPSGGEATDRPVEAPAEEPPVAREGESEVAARETTALLDDGATEPLAQPSAPSGLVQIPALSPAISPEPPTVPQPTGVSSFVQSPVATPLQTMQVDIAAPTGGVPVAAAAGVTAPAAVVDVPLSPAPIAIAVTPAVTATDVAAPVLAAAQPATGAVAEMLETVVGIADALPASALASTVLASTVLPSAVLGVAEQATAIVDTLPIESFAGTNPVAGLTTLVGMVESSEAFDIVDATAAVPDLPQPSILDALVADTIPSPLLGEDESGSGLLDTGIDLGL